MMQSKIVCPQLPKRLLSSRTDLKSPKVSFLCVDFTIILKISQGSENAKH